MFTHIVTDKDETNIVPIYGCYQSPYQTLDLSQLTFFKSDDAFAQTDLEKKPKAKRKEDTYYFNR